MDEGQVSFEEMEHRALEQERNTKKFFMKLFRIALETLSHRLLVYLSLLAAICLFAWAMLEPTVLRLICAVLFTGMTFLPSLYRPEKNDGNN